MVLMTRHKWKESIWPWWNYSLMLAFHIPRRAFVTRPWEYGFRCSMSALSLVVLHTPPVIKNSIQTHWFKPFVLTILWFAWISLTNLKIFSKIFYFHCYESWIILLLRIWHVVQLCIILFNLTSHWFCYDIQRIEYRNRTEKENHISRNFPCVIRKWNIENLQTPTFPHFCDLNNCISHGWLPTTCKYSNFSMNVSGKNESINHAQYGNKIGSES